MSTHEKWVQRLNEARRAHLGSLVRFLCLPVKFAWAWGSFASFVDLEYLEISGFGADFPSNFVFRMPERGLGRLRTVKLRGYFPKEVVRKEADSIEELQLGILVAPIGNECIIPNDERNSSTPEDERLEELADLSEEDAESVEEDIAPDWVAPRALPCLTPRIMYHSTNLKKLYLVKPSNREKSMEFDLYFSSRSDKSILKEWNPLLKATRKTLEVLTLDQRAVAEDSNKEFMRRCANGRSYKRFIEMVPPALLESEEYPNLKIIRVFGFEPHEEGIHKLGWIGRDYPDESVDVPGQLRAAFPDAEVTDYAGRRMIIWNGTGEVLSGKQIAYYKGIYIYGTYL
ncbi:hypothetical protein N0V90_011248 [Kalmusia sp. IMI 367209]|nr:hypothetical protein N0V90_011248 [Kalmusia sp. IMI 367209]